MTRQEEQARAEQCPELQPFQLPFVEIRRWQNRTAFATKDFSPGDTVIEEKGFVQWAETEDELAGAVAPGNEGFSAAGFKNANFVRAYHAENKKMTALSKTAAAAKMPALEFFSPCFFIDWQNTTPEQILKSLDLFYHDLGVLETVKKDRAEGLDSELGTALRVCEAFVQSCLPGAFRSKKDKSFFTGEHLFRFLQVCDINVHKDNEDKQGRCGLFVIGSKFTHSCQANCAWSFSTQQQVVNPGRGTPGPPKLKYVAVRHIKKGDALSFSYIGDGLNVCAHTVERRQTLRKLHFLCECERCVAALDYSRGGICGKCGSERCFVVNRDVLGFRLADGEEEPVGKAVERMLAGGEGGGGVPATAPRAIPPSDYDFFTEPQPVGKCVSRDVYYCLDCGNDKQEVSPALLQVEQALTKRVPDVIDAELRLYTFQQRQELLAAFEQHFGRFHYGWCLACFGYLQACLTIVASQARVDVCLQDVKKRCLELDEAAATCFKQNYLQRLRLTGLIAHIEKALAPLGLFKGALGLPLYDPLSVWGVEGVGPTKHRPSESDPSTTATSSAPTAAGGTTLTTPTSITKNVVTGLLRHEKFRYLDVFLWKRRDEVFDPEFEKFILGKCSTKLVNGEWVTFNFAGS
eukprot:g578.t1